MKKTLFILLCFVGLLFSCKKESHNQFSHWHVGNDSFASNNVNVSYEYDNNGLYEPAIKTGIILSCLESNGFAISFHDRITFLTAGIIPIDNGADTFHTPTADMKIYYHSGSTNKIYYPSLYGNYSLSASSVNGKAQYILSPTPFINMNDHSDSVIIHGVFNQP